MILARKIRTDELVFPVMEWWFDGDLMVFQPPKNRDLTNICGLGYHGMSDVMGQYRMMLVVLFYDTTELNLSSRFAHRERFSMGPDWYVFVDPIPTAWITSLPINTHANEPDFRSDVSTDVSTVAAEIYSLDSIGVKDLAHTHTSCWCWTQGMGEEWGNDPQEVSTILPFPGYVSHQ